MNAAARRPELSSFISLVNLAKRVSKQALPRHAHSNVHVRGPCSERAETRGEQYTNVTNVDRKVEGMEDVVNDAACGHQSRVDGTADDTSERVPCGMVEPVPERLGQKVLVNEKSDILHKLT